MGTIQIPDPVIVWEVEENRDEKWDAHFTVRAVVGSVTIFEQGYRQDDDSAWFYDRAYDAEEAKERAAKELGRKLERLLNPIEED